MWALLAHLDDYAGWLAAVVAGLAALGWLGRRVWRIGREVVRRAKEVARKIDTLEELAGYELNPNGGGSIKDRVGKIPALEETVRELSNKYESHDRNLRGIRADQRATSERVGVVEEVLSGVVDRLSSLSPPATSVVVTPETTTVETKAAS